MSQIKLVHSGGNGVIISAPSSNPASDINFKLPSTTGSSGEVLQNSSTAGTLEMGSPFRPAFSAFTSTGFNIAGSGYTKALFQTELFDTDSAYNTSTSTFTVPANMGGAYQLNAQIAVDDINDGDYAAIILYIDGTEATGCRAAHGWCPASGKIVTVALHNVIELTAGQTVNIYIFHNASGTQASENHMCCFSMFRLGGVPT